MTSVSTSISVGWPIPTGLTVEKKEGGTPVPRAIFSWDKVTQPYISSLDPSNNGGFNNIYWRVSVNNRNYLVYTNPIFEMTIPFVSGTQCKTCVKVQTIYDLSSNSYAPNMNLATSDWSDEVCIQNRPDLYCQGLVKNTTVTQNYGSMNMRYSRAVRMGRFGSSRGAAAYSFYK